MKYIEKLEKIDQIFAISDAIVNIIAPLPIIRWYARAVCIALFINIPLRVIQSVALTFILAQDNIRLIERIEAIFIFTIGGLIWGIYESIFWPMIIYYNINS